MSLRGVIHMEKKRITMKDVAKEAGVSTATVSYVLNYSETERITHETRLRVFAVAKKLGYIPNMTAKSLASKRSMLVGIIINMEEKNRKSKLYQYYDLTREIQKVLNEKGYDVFFITTKEVDQDISISRRRSLDAVFIMDMKEGSLIAIAKQFFVPTIFIDGYVEDSIFCKILADPEEIVRKAEEILGKDFYVVIEDYANKNLLNHILKKIDETDVFVNRDTSSLIAFLNKNKNRKGLVIGELLGVQVEKYVDNRNLLVVVHSDSDNMLLPDTKTILISNKEKAKKAVEVMEKLLMVNEEGAADEITYIHLR